MQNKKTFDNNSTANTVDLKPDFFGVYIFYINKLFAEMTQRWQ
jgi:hypothetical protein